MWSQRYSQCAECPWQACSSEPSVPRGLAILVVQSKQSQCLKASAADVLRHARWKLLAGQPQSIVFARAVGFDYPACQN